MKLPEHPHMFISLRCLWPVFAQYLAYSCNANYIYIYICIYIYIDRYIIIISNPMNRLKKTRNPNNYIYIWLLFSDVVCPNCWPLEAGFVHVWPENRIPHKENCIYIYIYGVGLGVYLQFLFKCVILFYHTIGLI